MTHLKEIGTLQLLKWWKDSKIPVIQYSRVSVLRVVNPEKKDTIHFNADASNTELLFRIIHSVNQLSVYGAVSSWCEQFGLTEEEKGQERQIIRDQRCIDKCGMARSETLGIFYKTSIWKGFAGKHSGKQFDSQGFANSHRSGTGYQLV